ncbi:MAG TPA: peptidyl-prolyl cis-trans isomerase [Solirubrobacteraceae bacterium]|nr:peptidyl-prolyl cis-trans isomerase [Solirubrobacteraceae bacterium]
MKTTKRKFAALGALCVLALGLAGCGSSSVPSGAVAQVAGNPISVQAFNHWMYVAAKGNSAQSGGPTIVPNDPPSFAGCIRQIRAQIPTLAKTPETTLKTECKTYFTQLSGQVMDFLIKAYWYQATAYKQGVHVTPAELQKAFKTAQKQTFPTQAQFKTFMAETGETLQDINFRLRVNTVFQKLIAKLTPKITPAAEQTYYKAHQSQFGTPESRNVKLIQTASQAQIQKAQAALKSGQSWAAVAKQYSTNSATKATGGVITDLTSGQEEAAVNKVIFAAPLNKIEGPIHGTFGYYLVEVTKVTPATTIPFTKAQPEIKALLTQQDQTSAQNTINKRAKAEWGGQTFCKPDYAMADCHGYTPPKTATTATPAPATGGTGAASSSGGTVTVNPSGGATSTGTTTSSGTTTK